MLSEPKQSTGFLYLFIYNILVTMVKIVFGLYIIVILIKSSYLIFFNVFFFKLSLFSLNPSLLSRCRSNLAPGTNKVES